MGKITEKIVGKTSAVLPFAALFLVAIGCLPVSAAEQAFKVMPAAGTAAVTLTDAKEEFSAAFVTKDFGLDGSFSRKEWDAAMPLPPLVLCADGAPYPYRGTVKVLYSKTALYVGGEMFQPMDSARAQYDQRDQPIWEDDNVEFSLCLPFNGVPTPYHFVVNPLGSIADLRNGNREYWARKRDAKAIRHGDRWTFEWKLPYAGIPMDRPIAGDFIGFRLCRTIHAPKKTVGSMPRMAGYEKGVLTSFAKVEAFGKLIFSAPAGANAAEHAKEMSNCRQLDFRKILKERLDGVRKRCQELSGCAAAFDGEDHPLFRKARQGLVQMKDELEAFESGNGGAVRRGEAVSLDAAKRFLGAVEGFDHFSSDWAYLAWQTDPWEKGSPQDRPPADAVRLPERIVFEQAGNEREAVCLEFVGALCGAGLDIRIVPLSATKGKTFISCDNFEVAMEPFIRFDGDMMTGPLVRSPGNLVTLSSGVAKRVWIMFNSRGVPPGEYETKIVLKSAHDARVADREIPVTIKIWNFTLPETKDWPLQSFVWGPELFRHDEVTLLKLMHDYHFTHGWTKSRQYWYGLKNDRNVIWPSKALSERGFNPELAKTAGSDFFRVAKELNMKFVMGWNTPLKLEWYKLMVDRLHGLGFRDDEFIFKGLISDEFGAKAIPRRAKEREMVWSWNTNLWFQAVLLSTPPPTGPTLEQIEKAKLPEFYRMWTVIHGLLKDPVRGPETRRVLKSKGAQVWSYQCRRYIQRRDVLEYFRFYPWECRLMGLDGMAYYTILTPEGDDGWDARDGLDEGMCWRGIDKKPVPTKRLEAVREGLEDVAYMDLLEKIVKGGSAALHSDTASIDAAKKLLAERGDIIKARNQRRVDAWRILAGRVIDMAASAQVSGGGARHPRLP